MALIIPGLRYTCIILCHFLLDAYMGKRCLMHTAEHEINAQTHVRTRQFLLAIFKALVDHFWLAHFIFYLGYLSDLQVNLNSAWKMCSTVISCSDTASIANMCI